MPRLHLVVALALASVVTLPTIARAEETAPAPAPAKPVASTASAAMGKVMLVLDVLGIVEKNAAKAVTLARAHARTPTWLAPEPPKTPLLYSSLVVAKF